VAKNSIESYGAQGKTNLLFFDPEDLHLVTDKSHPLYDPRVELDVSESLVASIAYFGVKEPVIVWKDPETGKTCVLAGRQRVKAARAANKLLKKRGEPPKMVKAIVERGEKPNLLATMKIENEGRVEPTASERAKSAAQLLAAGYDEATVAIILHCSRSALKNYLALLDAPAVIRNAVDAGKLSATHAYSLSKLEPAEAKEKLGKMLSAAEGTNGTRQRAAKMREATDGPKGRSRKEVQRLRDELNSAKPGAVLTGWLSALDWVLGKHDDAPELS
jgi:ParB family chromosome partitioning protein